MFQHTLSVPEGKTPGPDWIQRMGLRLPINLSDLVDSIYLNRAT